MTDDIGLPEGGYCAACNTIKPIKEFTRLLTYAESKARGYKGDYRVEILMHTCKSCQPKRKPLTQMTRKQIHNAVEAGDARLQVAQKLLKKMDQATAEGKRRGAYSRWAKERAKKWAPLIYALNRDMATLHQQEKYAKTKLRPAILAYAVRYKEILNNMRYRMRKDCDVYDRLPPEDWRDCIKPHEMDEIKGLWAAIPLDQRHRMTRPALLNTNYTPPVYEPKVKTVQITGGQVTVVDERSIHNARVHQERLDFLDEVRAQKEAERAARIAQGEIEADTRPIVLAEMVTPAKPRPPRLVSAQTRAQEADTEKFLEDLLAGRPTQDEE